MEEVLRGISRGAHDIGLFAARGGHRNIVFEMIKRGCKETTPMGIHALVILSLPLIFLIHLIINIL